jgi:hypothetical protein
MRTFQQFLESKSVLGIRSCRSAELLTNYEMNESVCRIDSDRVDEF